MKEIDFLPEWYKTGNRRRVSYRRQYLVIGGLFVTLMTWSFAASYSISIVEGQVNMMQQSLDSHESVAAKYAHYNKVLALLEERSQRLEDLDPDINLSGIFAELSYISSDLIMLNDLDLQSEVVAKDVDGISIGVVSLTSSQGDREIAMPYPNVRYKLKMQGVASGAAAVTDFIAQLENSPYFCLVVPGLMEHMKDSTSTRFQISCYIANYVTE